MKKIMSLVLVLAMLITGSFMLSLYRELPNNVFVYDGITYTTDMSYNEYGHRVATVTNCQGEKVVVIYDGENFHIEEHDQNAQSAAEISTINIAQAKQDMFEDEDNNECFLHYLQNDPYLEAHTSNVIQPMSSGCTQFHGRAGVVVPVFGYVGWNNYEFLRSTNPSTYNTTGHLWILSAGSRGSHLAFDLRQNGRRRYAEAFMNSINSARGHINNAVAIAAPGIIAAIISGALAKVTFGKSVLIALAISLGTVAAVGSQVYYSSIHIGNARMHFEDFRRATT